MKQEDKRTETKTEKSDAAGDVKKGDVDSPKFIPFAVRKRADTVAAGSRKQTVQALKKKYQDQRIAKNKAQCKTRSSAAKEVETTKMPKPKQNETSAKNNVSNDTSGRGNKRKLRGTVANDQPNEEPITTKSQKTAKDSNVRPQKTGDANKVSVMICEQYHIKIILQKSVFNA